MKTRITILLASVAVLALAGCSGSGDQSAESAKQTVETAAKDVSDAATDAAAKMQDAMAAVADLAPKEGETLLVGTMGCGHCNFHIGDSCAAAMKTADGTVYIMEGVEAGNVLFDERKSEKPIQVVGTTTEKDGVHYVTVRQYNM
jgi:hypothetical protein